MNTSNVLLTREGSAKVADVGLATMTDYFSSATACPGTFMYVAPEVLMGRSSNTKVTTDHPYPYRYGCPHTYPDSVTALQYQLKHSQSCCQRVIHIHISRPTCVCGDESAG